jgi:hypothetical protein
LKVGPLQTFVDIEKSGLSPHRSISDLLRMMESETPPEGEDFRAGYPRAVEAMALLCEQ